MGTGIGLKWTLKNRFFYIYTCVYKHMQTNINIHPPLNKACCMRLKTAPSLKSSASWCSVLQCPGKLLAALLPYITIHPPKWALAAHAVLCEQEVSSLRDKLAMELLFHMTPTLIWKLKNYRKIKPAADLLCSLMAWLQHYCLCLASAFIPYLS